MPSMASDPFRAAVNRERLTKVGGLLLLIAFLLVLILIASRNDFRNAASVDAVVLRLGTYADETGDLSVLTVRMGDGSVRQFQTTWAAVKWCRPGSRVWLMQRGSNLRVALRGCERPTS